MVEPPFCAVVIPNAERSSFQAKVDLIITSGTLSPAWTPWVIRESQNDGTSGAGVPLKFLLTARIWLKG